jgi:hypothetical protein
MTRFILKLPLLLPLLPLVACSLTVLAIGRHRDAS